jgi:excisionase family DNA binding protein
VSDGPTSTDYLTVDEAAAEFRVSASALYRALREQRVPGVKILGRWRISRKDFQAFASREARAARQRANPMPSPSRTRRSDGFRDKVMELRERTPR